MSNPRLYKQDAAGQVIAPHPDWADVAGLNYANPDTRRYMREMLQYWARELQLDGFRCDVAAEVSTGFWEEVREDLEKIRPGLFLLAEADKPDLLVHAFDADYAWRMLGTLNKVLMEGAPASEFRRTWEESEQRAFPRGSLHLRCTDNHDECAEAARNGQFGDPASGVLVAALRPDGLTRTECHGEAAPADVHHLPPLRPQVHLDTAGRLVESGDMLELAKIEVGVQFPVDPSQQVQVERRGHAQRIVVSFQHARQRLQKIGAEQQ